jgi:hypothetical protein
MKKLISILSLLFIFSCGVDTAQIESLLSDAESAYNSRSDSDLLPLIAQDSSFYENVQNGVYFSGDDFPYTEASFADLIIPDEYSDTLLVELTFSGLSSADAQITDNSATAEVVNEGGQISQTWKLSALTIQDNRVYQAPKP